MKRCFQQLRKSLRGAFSHKSVEDRTTEMCYEFILDALYLTFVVFETKHPEVSEELAANHELYEKMQVFKQNNQKLIEEMLTPA